MLQLLFQIADEMRPVLHMQQRHGSFCFRHDVFQILKGPFGGIGKIGREKYMLKKISVHDKKHRKLT